jgi:hypothetical protein
MCIHQQLPYAGAIGVAAAVHKSWSMASRLHNLIFTLATPVTATAAAAEAATTL